MKILGKQRVLKQINRKAILNMLRSSDGISVAELSKKSKLSKTTLMKIMNYYIEKGLIFIAGKGSSTEEGGKKPNIFKFNKDGGYAIGMIISANRLFSVITNLNSEIVDKISMELKTNENFDIVLVKIIDSYNYLVSHSGVDRKKIIGIAVGAYGITNMNEGIVLFSPHFPSWGENIELKKKMVEKLTDGIPVIVDNHARFQVFAEKIIGLGKEKSNIVIIQAGKGMVAGVIMEGEIKRGNHFLVGEIGHMVIDPDSDELCACGGKGCFEAIVSTDRILRIARENYKVYNSSSIFNGKSPDKIEINDIFNALDKNDKLALKLIDELIEWFAIGISNIILMYDPQTIIIQGIYTGAGQYFLRKLRDRVNRISLFNIKKKTEIEYSKLGDKAGVLGAASYVISEYFE